MSILACALMIPAFAPVVQPTEAWSASPLSEFLAPLPSAAFAFESDAADAADSLLSYTYVEVGGGQDDVDGFEDNVDIYYGRASLSLLFFFHLFAEYSNQSMNFANTDANQYELGIGAHFGILPTLDLVAEVGGLYSDVSSDNNSLDGSDTGYEVSGGARWLVMPWTTGGLELNATVGTIKLDNRLGSDDNPTFYGGGVRVHFLKFLSVGANYEKIQDDDMILGSVRFSF